MLEEKNVPVEEKNETQTKVVAKLLPERDRSFQTWVRKPVRDLSKPFDSLHWPLAAPALFCSLAAVLLFTRIIDLGSIPINWALQFNVNVAAALIILLAGALATIPRARKNPRIWSERNTYISLGLLVLLAAYFLLGGGHLGPINGLNLGIFTYTFTNISSNVLVMALLIILLFWLAFQGSRIAGVALFGLFLWWGLSLPGFSWDNISGLFSSQNAGLLKSMLPPKWNYFSLVLTQMLLTIQTAILAMVIGVIGALPLSILAARNTTPHLVIYTIVRFVINIIRSIPSLVLALIFVTFIGLGPVPGAFGLGLHTISVLTKLYSEGIESVKPEPIEALSAAGANALKRFRWGVFPQAFPLLASSTIYYWESNTRDATVVAFVGGGGIGFLLDQNLSLLNYANVSVILVTLVVTVILLDRVSDFVRSKVL